VVEGDRRGYDVRKYTGITAVSGKQLTQRHFCFSPKEKNGSLLKESNMVNFYEKTAQKDKHLANNVSGNCRSSLYSKLHS